MQTSINIQGNVKSIKTVLKAEKNTDHADSNINELPNKRLNIDIKMVRIATIKPITEQLKIRQFFLVALCSF